MRPPPRPFRPPRRAEPEHRINDRIQAEKLRLVGENVEQGVYPLSKALAMAVELELDLVEVVPNADPPVCRIVDYQKFLYEKKKKDKELKAKTHKAVVKEIRFTPNTDDHDFEFKAKHAEKFVKEGAKLKAFVNFRGRNIQFKDRGELLLLKLAQRLEDVAVLQMMPKVEGRRMIAIFSPKTGGKKKA
jgi:translation initiation factor IF-3